PSAVAAAWGVPVATVKTWRTALAKPSPRFPSAEPKYGINRPWTPEEDAVVFATPNIYEVAAKLGRTPGACRSRRRFVLRAPVNGTDRTRKPKRTATCP